MNILKELLNLSEATSEKNLLGLTINKIKIDKDTTRHKWKGGFDCSRNNLTSLEHAPSEVGGFFYCGNNKLTSLKFAPLEVGSFFSCSFNKLTSLEHAPSIIDGDFDCSDNKLTSLKDIHKILKKMDGTFFAAGNPIKSQVLGLLLIPGCKALALDYNRVDEILNKYLPNTRGNKAVIECQSELLDANLEDYAEL